MKGHSASTDKAADRTARAAVSPRVIGVMAVALAALLWSFWPAVVQLAKDWWNSDDYSVCQLVPLVALFLVWRQRRALRQCRVAPCWWGIGVVAVALAARFYGLFGIYESAERYALVLAVFGLVLLIAGVEVFKRTIWVLLFLFLMVPLPGQVHNVITGPLQTLATNGAVFLLELSGVGLTQQGNVLILSDGTPITVAEACSGLRMLTAFTIVAATLAFIVRRPRWQKAALVVSSVPVALICNVLRLWATAQLFVVADSKTAQWFFHDFAGYAMMPLAVIILAGELWLMNRLVVHETRGGDDGGAGPGRGNGAGGPRKPAAKHARS